MESTIHPVARGNRSRYWRRVLRPLVWWFGLVFMLFAIRTHKRLSEQTRIHFTVALGEENLMFMLGASPTFDHKPVENGQMIPIGWHTFAITHPKGEPFSTNLFVWYGGHDFGRIDLKRAKGVLELQVDPKAALVSIRGPQHSETWTNSGGGTLTLPTDDYALEASYAHWKQHEVVRISSQLTNSVRFSPPLGALSLTCNREEASFELVTTENQMIEAGGFPATILEVPEGTYRVRTQHHRNRFEQSVTAKAGTTNTVQVELAYGSAYLSTEPSGATVLTDDGHDWGTTPLTLSELPVGTWHFLFQRSGYESATVSLQVGAGTTVNFQTNLVSFNYTAAISSAEHYFENKDYAGVSRAAGDALLAKPDDPVALKIKRESTAFESLARAEDMGKKGDYISGMAELEKALSVLPDNAEAIQLLADFKEREPAQREQLRLERLHRGEQSFKVALARHPGGEWFDQHELKSPKPVKAVAEAIVNALGDKPEFQIDRYKWITPETFEIDAVQEFSTYLATSAGKRVCVILGAQTTDAETQILFEVFEYKAEAVYKFSLGNLIGAPGTVNYVPIHAAVDGKLPEKLKVQLNEGISNVTARIEGAIGSIQK